MLNVNFLRCLTVTALILLAGCSKRSDNPSVESITTPAQATPAQAAPKAEPFQISAGKSVMVGGILSSSLKPGAKQLALSHAICSSWRDDPGVFYTRVTLTTDVSQEQLNEFREFEKEVDARLEMDQGKSVPGDFGLYLQVDGSPEQGADVTGELIGYGFAPQSLPFTGADMSSEFYFPFGTRKFGTRKAKAQKIRFELNVGADEPVSANYDFGRLESLLPQADLIICGTVHNVTNSSVEFEVLRVLRGDTKNLRLNRIASQERSAHLNGCISDMSWPTGRMCCLFIRDGALVNFGDGIQQLPYEDAITIDELEKIVHVWDQDLGGRDLQSLRDQRNELSATGALVFDIVDNQPTLESPELWKKKISQLKSVQ